MTVIIHAGTKYLHYCRHFGVFMCQLEVDMGYLPQLQSTYLELTNLVVLSSQEALGFLLYLSAPHWDCRYLLLHLAFYVGTGNPNSGPRS